MGTDPSAPRDAGSVTDQFTFVPEVAVEAAARVLAGSPRCCCPDDWRAEPMPFLYTLIRGQAAREIVEALRDMDGHGFVVDAADILEERFCSKEADPR